MTSNIVYSGASDSHGNTSTEFYCTEGEVSATAATQQTSKVGVGDCDVTDPTMYYSVNECTSEKEISADSDNIVPLNQDFLQEYDVEDSTSAERCVQNIKYQEQQSSINRPSSSESAVVEGLMKSADSSDTNKDTDTISSHGLQLGSNMLDKSTMLDTEHEANERQRALSSHKIDQHFHTKTEWQDSSCIGMMDIDQETQHHQSSDLHFSHRPTGSESDVQMQQMTLMNSTMSNERMPDFIGPVLPSSQKSLVETNEEFSWCSSNSKQGTNRDKTIVLSNDHRFNLSTVSVPKLLKSSTLEFRRSTDENFLRGCKWSPDGNCVLTNSNDNCLRVFHPFDRTDSNGTGCEDDLAPKVKMKESSQIYDFAWHPKMLVSATDYGRIACTCSGIPIHMWNAETGQIVANYRAYDQYDEITAAYSLSFSLDGSKIYAGYNKAIRIFDTEYPARLCKTVKTFNSQKRDGQTGIISCVIHSPDGSGLYVAGSYSRHIGIYDAACDKLVCLMQGQQGGVTHLMFSPDATKLYSGGRKDTEILCWDMRNMGRILFSALREVKTNQRIYFDLSQSGRYLTSGNQDGTVAFWDTLSPLEEFNGDMFLKPCSQFQAHRDCVNGVSFNPLRDMIATASGQRHFRNFQDCDSDDSNDDTEMESTKPWDFSLRLWQIPVSL